MMMLSGNNNMSCTYKCDFCGKNLTAHKYIRNSNFFIPKKFHRSKIENYIKINYSIEVTPSSVDICDDCMDEVRIESIKEIKKIKYKE